jgi:hypothetical protein
MTCLRSSAPTHSLAGLAVKARAAAFAQSQLWDEPFDDLDCGPKTTRALIEAVFSAAGLPTVPEYLETENPEAKAAA